MNANFIDLKEKHSLFLWGFPYFSLFETGSHYVAQANSKSRSFYPKLHSAVITGLSYHTQHGDFNFDDSFKKYKCFNSLVSVMLTPAGT
jgi:hypothetical protein